VEDVEAALKSSSSNILPVEDAWWFEANESRGREDAMPVRLILGSFATFIRWLTRSCGIRPTLVSPTTAAFAPLALQLAPEAPEAP
jgi:hypothetical protein